jgi:Plasmid replication region DNA-binding N-term
MNNNDLRSQCERDPAYLGGSAYDRTKVVCRLLTEAGQPIPGWMPIRDIIGKGSATDINRGIKAFREDHASLLRTMRGGDVAMPEALARRFTDLWADALVEAGKTFADDVQSWQAQIGQAQELQQAAEAARDDLSRKLLETQAVVERLNGELSTAQARIAAEREARDQTERLYQQQSEDMRHQQSRLEEITAEASRERAAALERLDGERKRALMEIEAARQEKIQAVAKATQMAASEQAHLKTEVHRAQMIADEARREAARAAQDTAAARALVAELRAQLAKQAAAQTADAKRPGRRGVQARKAVRGPLGRK